MNGLFRRSLFVPLGFTIWLTAMPGTSAAADEKSAGVESSATAKVDVTRNIAYCDIPDDSQRSRHQLDVYRPSGGHDCPVLFFVHGGAWIAGWKDKVLGVFGYGSVGEVFARHGFVVVMPNYRLSPGVRHPEHIKDVARAFAWTCEHVRDHGGDPSRIFVAGHSAGGHLVTLLATDETYLKAEGRSENDIRGVIGISGVYCLCDLALEMSFGDRKNGVSFELGANPLFPIFGGDPDVLRQASPITHVRPGLPPFLLINGALDLLPLPPMTRKFAAALREQGTTVRTKSYAWRTHESVLFDFGHLDVDAATRDAVLAFIAEVEKTNRKAD